MTIAGAAEFDLGTFIWPPSSRVGSAFSCGSLLRDFGEPIRTFIERRLTLLTWLFLIALIGGFVAFRYIF